MRSKNNDKEQKKIAFNLVLDGDFSLRYNKLMLDPVLISLIVFGAWISYCDIKKSEIKNYSLLALILVGIFINLFFTKAFIFFPSASLINIFGAAAVGVMIWLAGIWSAADAKLFIAINFLFPVTYYQHFFGHCPGFIILINSAVPFFFFLLLQILFKTSLKEKWRALSLYLKPSFIGHLLLVSSAIFCITFYVANIFRINLEYLLWIILLFSLFWLVEEKLKIKLTCFFIFILALAPILAFIFNLPLFTQESLISVLTFFSRIFFLFVLLALADPLFTRSVKIANLEEGMIPAEMIVKDGEFFVKKPITFLAFLALLRQRTKFKAEIGFNPDGLLEEEIAQIRSLHEKGLLKADALKVSVTTPLAVILFLGALLTYFIKGLFVNLF